MTPGFGPTRKQKPYLPYPEKDRVIINAHNFNPPPSGPVGIGGEVAWWCPSLDDDGNGTTTLYDLTGNGWDGTLTNMDAATDWVADTNNGGIRCLDFDGVNDRVATSLNLLNGETEKTITMWLNPLTTASNANFEGYAGSQSTSTARVMVLNAGSIAGRDDIFFAVGNGANSAGYTTGNVLSDNTWKHWVFEFNGNGTGNAGRCKIWCDGVDQTLAFSNTIPATLANVSAAFNLASINTGSNSICRLDDIRIFDRLLTSGEIANLASQRGYQP